MAITVRSHSPVKCATARGGAGDSAQSHGLVVSPQVPAGVRRIEPSVATECSVVLGYAEDCAPGQESRG